MSVTRWGTASFAHTTELNKPRDDEPEPAVTSGRTETDAAAEGYYRFGRLWARKIDGKRHFEIFGIPDNDEAAEMAGWLIDRIGGPVEPSQVAVTDRAWTHTCESCGEPFAGVRSDARYCSPACRQRAYRERYR